MTTSRIAAIILASVTLIYHPSTSVSAQVVSPLEADDDTLLLYHFDGEGPRVVDAGPLALHGRVVQHETRGTVESPGRVRGVTGQALKLHSGQTLIPDHTPDELRGVDRFTLELWFRTTSEAPMERQRLVVYWGHYLLSIFEGGRLMGHLYDQDGTKYILRGHGTIQPHRWYHVAITWNGKRAKLWLNGREQDSVRMTGRINPEPGSGLRVGGTGDEWFQGTVDELRISSVARVAFPAARQFNFCHPAETLLIRGSTARLIFEPLVPKGVETVTCRASLGETCKASTTVEQNAFEPYGDNQLLGHTEVVLQVPPNNATSRSGARESTHTGTISYQHKGNKITAHRDFPVVLESMIEPPATEFRGAWTHSHRMENPDDLFSRMAACGLNAAVMRVRRGETAYYNSALGPISEIPFDNKDLIHDCVAACRRHGIDLHCYVNNFPIGSPQSEYAQGLRAAGRWQKSADGADVPWLCPSHPENLNLVEAAMVELVRDYDIAGVQYDFIRYGRDDVCFCDRCRSKFEARIGHAVGNWPQDCLPDGTRHAEWMDQRADLITSAVRRTTAAVRGEDPDAVISAAVFAMPPHEARRRVGQEWDLWCREGLLDALCPMSYVADNHAHRATVSMVLDAVGDYLPVYAGIGLRSGQQRMHYPEELAAKLNMVRGRGAPGFTMFCITPKTDAPETVLMPLRERFLPGDGRDN